MHRAKWHSDRWWGRWVAAVILVSTVGFAQTGPDASNSSWAVDQGATPKALAPGAPAGVYDLSGFEHINLYNGHLNIAFPLLKIGGRGEAGYQMMLAVDSPKWIVDLTPQYYPGSTCGNGPPGSCLGGYQYSATIGSWWNLYPQGYSPGVLIYKRISDGLMYCPDANATFYGNTFGYFVFVGPDGTETPLYAAEASGGAPISRTCSNLGSKTARGPLFLSSDGSIAFYAVSALGDLVNVSDQDTYPLGASVADSTGTLILANGTQYRFTQGAVNQIIDRNGNTITLDGGVGRPSHITDSLGRVTTIEYGVSDGVCTQLSGADECDRIGFTRLNASGSTETRYIHIHLVDFSSQIVRPDLLPIPSPLFPISANVQMSRKPVEITLPNGAKYDIQYTPYGEVARVVLPTGGAIEYDHAAGLSNAGSPGVSTSGQVLDLWDLNVYDWDPNTGVNPPTLAPFIYRRLTARRVYANGGSKSAGTTPDSTTTYSQPEAGTNPVYSQTSPGKVTGLSITNVGYVDVTQTASGQPQMFERHHFYDGSGVSSTPPYWTVGVTSSSYGPAADLQNQALNVSLPLPDLFEGKESTTETGGSSTSILRTVDRVWTMVSVSDVTQQWVPADTRYEDQPAGAQEVQLCQEQSTLNDTSQVSGKVYLYDRNLDGSQATALGNVTDVYEYDYGAAPSISTTTTILGYTGRLCATPTSGFKRRTHTDFVSADARTPTASTYAAMSPRRRAARNTHRQQSTSRLVDGMTAWGTRFRKRMRTATRPHTISAIATPALLNRQARHMRLPLRSRFRAPTAMTRSLLRRFPTIGSPESRCSSRMPTAKPSPQAMPPILWTA